MLGPRPKLKADIPDVPLAETLTGIESVRKETAPGHKRPGPTIRQRWPL
jgi:hypothetical protein